MRALVHTGAFVSVALGALAIYIMLTGAFASLVIRRVKARRPVLNTEASEQALEEPWDPLGVAERCDALWHAGLDPSLIVLDTLLDDLQPLENEDPHLVLAASRKGRLRARDLSRSPEKAAVASEKATGERTRARGAWSLPALAFRRKAADVTAPPSPAPMYAAALIVTACIVGALIFSDSGVIPHPHLWSGSQPVTKAPADTVPHPAAQPPLTIPTLPSRPAPNRLADRAPQPLITSPVGSLAQVSPAPAIEVSLLTTAVKPSPSSIKIVAAVAKKPTPKRTAATAAGSKKALARAAAQPAKHHQQAKPRKQTQRKQSPPANQIRQAVRTSPLATAAAVRAPAQLKSVKPAAAARIAAPKAHQPKAHQPMAAARSFHQRNSAAVMPHYAHQSGPHKSHRH